MDVHRGAYSNGACYSIIFEGMGMAVRTNRRTQEQSRDNQIFQIDGLPNFLKH